MSRTKALALVLSILLATLAACESNVSNSKTPAGNGAMEDRVSPLGLGQPDPERLFEGALAAYEAGDVWRFLSYFAFVNRTGNYFVPAPSPESDAPPPEVEDTRHLAHALRSLMSSDYANFTYGRPVNVRDDPMTAQVPVSVSYDFSGLDENRKSDILAEINELIRNGGGVPLTWEQYKTQLLNGPRQSARRFVYLDKEWRFDAGWRLTR